MEQVRGRFGGFFSIGSEEVRLPDFDEALFGIPGLLNFNMILSGEPGRETLELESQMLTGQDATSLIEQALQTIPVIQRLQLSIHCHYNPAETGSILKRCIIDKRGQNA